MEPCEKLQKLENGSGKAMIFWSVDTVAKANDCSMKVDAWIEIGKLFDH